MKQYVFVLIGLVLVGCESMPKGPSEVAVQCPPGSRAVAEAVSDVRGNARAQGTRVACVRRDGSYVAVRDLVLTSPGEIFAKREEASDFERKSVYFVVEDKRSGKNVRTGYQYQNPLFGVRIQAGTGDGGYRNSSRYNTYRQRNSGMCYVVHRNGISGWYQKSSISSSIERHAKRVGCY